MAKTKTQCNAMSGASRCMKKDGHKKPIHRSEGYVNGKNWYQFEWSDWYRAKDYHSGLWTREEAYDFLDTRYYMAEMTEEAQKEAIDGLCAMTHRPHCRTHMRSLFPNYGSDCTCDSAEKLGRVVP